MKIGDYIKVHLPGERPWAVVIKVINDNALLAKIDNHCVSPLHEHDYGDVLSVTKVDDHWEPGVIQLGGGK